jgi:hypothetical protein
MPGGIHSAISAACRCTSCAIICRSAPNES